MSSVVMYNRWALVFSVLKSSPHRGTLVDGLTLNIQRSRAHLSSKYASFRYNLYSIQTRMNHGIHYVSVCRTLVFLSHCTLRYRCTSEAQCSYARSLSVDMSPFIQLFIVFFLHWMWPSNVYCWRSSCPEFGHSPGWHMYHTWLLVRSRTSIRCQAYCDQLNVLVAV